MKINRQIPFVLAGVLLLVCLTPARADEAAEARIKAAIVYNVTKYATWPEVSDGSPERCLLGLIGENGMREALVALEGKLVDGRPLEVVVLEDPAAARNCQLVYFGPGSRGVGEDWLNELAASPVLTVGDTEGFATAGGMIELVRQRNRIGFAINTSAVEGGGMRLGSQLLKMAKLVEDR